MGETALVPPPAAVQINGLEDLRPGDLCFTKIGGFVPGVVPVGLGMLMLGERVRIGRLRFDHVLIVAEAARPLPGPPAPEDGPTFTGRDGQLYTCPRGVQAMPDGAEEIALTPERHWGPQVAYCRLPEDWPGQAADAAAIARLMVAAGVDYSFGSYAMLAAWKWGLKTPRLEARINRRLPEPVKLPRWSSGPQVATRGGAYVRGGRLPAEAICSVLVDQAWTLAGKRVMRGVKPQVVTPGALGVQLFARAGVLWGGAGILG